MSAKPARSEHPEVLRLAALPPLEYDAQRKAVAERLNVRPATLDRSVAAERARNNPSSDGSSGRRLPFRDVDPWPHPIDAAKVLDEMLACMRRYVVADAATLCAAVLWCALTWFQLVATVLPNALITAPEKNCGKTTLLEMMRSFVRRALLVSNISPAALFRCIEAWCPSLMIDEVDTFAKDNDELRGILNSGHTRDTAQVIRAVEVNGDFEPRVYSTWAPKALAGIGHLPATIESRSIILRMRRALPGEVVERLRHADRAPFVTLQAKLARWAVDAGDAFARLHPTLPELSNRDADNWEPILALAELAGGDWPERARDAARQLAGVEQSAASINMELLGDIREVFRSRAVDRLTTQTLLEALAADDEAPWSGWNRGRPMTARQLSSRLADFGIRPGTIRVGDRTPKGYHFEQFTEAFACYLPPVESATPPQRCNAKARSEFLSATSGRDVADGEMLEGLPQQACGGVADNAPGEWETER